MPEWFIFIVSIVIAIQTFGILGAIRQVLRSVARRIDTQTEAMEAAIEYQNIIWLGALEKETTPPSFGRN